ncbi:hypothetical protein [Limibacterium fermenti]|uniref:hypothetical protein n=1 Tax=Limibacterium fermenti TaxID=3229863 RepID=UPI000E99E05B|nr:hypothetical protein [Porphyromonadaceae bacterium]
MNYPYTWPIIFEKPLRPGAAQGRDMPIPIRPAITNNKEFFAAYMPLATEASGCRGLFLRWRKSRRAEICPVSACESPIRQVNHPFSTCGNAIGQAGCLFSTCENLSRQPVAVFPLAETFPTALCLVFPFAKDPFGRMMCHLNLFFYYLFIYLLKMKYYDY